MPGLGEGFGPAGPLKRDRTQMRVWAMQSRTGFWGLSRGTQAGPSPILPLIWHLRLGCCPPLAPPQVVHKDLHWGHGSS